MNSSRFVVALATLSLACAYYNGLYNANRLASEAERAESEGRRGDARSLWLQAAVRADSVASKHPDSKYWDDALLMSGRAQSRVGDCPLAMPPLARVVAHSTDPSLVAQGRILLAECQWTSKLFDAVVTTVDPLLSGAPGPFVIRARVLRGRAELARGNAAAAIRDLSPPPDPETRFDLVAALLANGQVREARDQLERAAASPYDETRWPGLLDSLAAKDAGAASGFVDRWVSDRNVPSNARVRLLLEDAARWTQQEQFDRAAYRLSQAVLLSEDSGLTASVRYRAALLELRRMDDISDLSVRTDAFRRLSETSTSGDSSALYVEILDRALQALMAQNGGDLLLFRAAEDVRDSLRQAGLAALLFAHVASAYGPSALVPKALLALAALRPEAADSIMTVLEREYADSPYTELATGGLGAGFAAVEDSLRRVLDAISRDSTRRLRGNARQ